MKNSAWIYSHNGKLHNKTSGPIESSPTKIFLAAMTQEKSCNNMQESGVEEEDQ